MNPVALLAFVVVAVVVLTILSTLRRRGGGKASIGYPYSPHRALFTPAERSFLGVLEQATGETHRIFGKVRLADVIKVEPGLTRSARQTAFNRISGKHLDFVLCERTDLKIVAGMELDDKSHDAPSRQQRDSFVDAALGAAGALHRFSAKRSYSVRKVRAKLPRAERACVAALARAARAAPRRPAPPRAAPRRPSPHNGARCRSSSTSRSASPPSWGPSSSGRSSSRT